MNRNLLGLAVLLVLIGLGFGSLFIILLGLLVLLPSMLPTRQPVRPQPRAANEAPRRITPRPVVIPPVTQSQPEPVSMQAAPGAPASMPTATPGYPPALFPTSMFPSLTQMNTSLPPAKETPQKKPEERDELLEAGAILAILKLAFG